MPSSPVTVDPADAVRPSTWTRIEMRRTSSATFWWMTELAKRVSAADERSTLTSASAPGEDASTRSSTRCARSSSLIGAPVSDDRA